MAADVQITVSPSMYSTDGWRHTTTFEDVFYARSHAEVRSKELAECFSVAWFKNNRRKKKDVEGVVGLVYEFDALGATTYNEAVTSLRAAQITAMVYTTFSHMMDGTTPKFRVVIPFDEAILSPKKEWFAAFHAFTSEQLGFQKYDVTCNQMERMYFVPSKPTGTDIAHICTYVNEKVLIPITDMAVFDLETVANNSGIRATTDDTTPLWSVTNDDTVDVREWWSLNKTIDIAEVLQKHAPSTVIETRDAGGVSITCPYHAEHSNQDENDRACFCGSPNDDYDFSTIQCLHAHCAERSTADFLHKMLVDKTLTFEQLTENSLTIDNVLDFPIENVNVKEMNTFFDDQKNDDELVFDTERFSEDGFVYDKELFKEKIVAHTDMTTHLFPCVFLSEFLEIVGPYSFSDLETQYALAFSAVPLDDPDVKKMVGLHLPFLKWLRMKCRNIVSAVRSTIATKNFVTDYVEDITELCATYDLTYDEVADVFISVRAEALTTDSFQYTSQQHTKALVEKFQELDKHYRRVGKGIVSKGSYTGKVYCNMARIKNVVVPRIGVYSAEELEDDNRYMNVRNIRTDDDLNVVRYWLNRPFVYPMIESLTCTPVYANGVVPDNIYKYNTHDEKANIPYVECDLEEFEREELPLFRDILAAGDEKAFKYIMTWASHTHQFTAKKLPTCMFFEGIQGAGKSLLIQAMFVDPHGVFGISASSKAQIFSNFNAALAGKHLVFYDEVSETLNFKNDGELKYFITSSKIRIEPKGVDSVEIDSFHHLVMASNNHNVVVLDDHDRRLSYFVVDSTKHNAPAFWKERVDKLKSVEFVGKMKYYLMNYKPEDHGSSWDILSRPFENEQRRERVERAKNTADTAIASLMSSLVMSSPNIPSNGMGIPQTALDAADKTEDGAYFRVPVASFRGAHFHDKAKTVTTDSRTIMEQTAFKTSQGIIVDKENGMILIPTKAKKNA